MAFEGVDDVKSGDGFSLGVLGVGDGVPDHIFEENFQNTSGLFVNKTRNALHSTTASQTADSGFCNSLDVITKDLSVTLSASFSKSFSSFTTS